MEARKVESVHGWLWIKQGVSLMLHNPLWTLLLSLIVVSVLSLAARLSHVAPILAMLLLPAIVAGYMRACVAMQQHERSVLAQLLAGFRMHTARLLALGGMLLGGVIFSAMVTAALGGEALMTFLQKAQEITDPEQLMAALQDAGTGVVTAFTAGLLVMLLLGICLQFAPMLVLLKGATTLEAIKTGLQGTLRNILPYTLYNLILLALLMLLGVLPPFIGSVLAFTVSMTTLYSAYQDIFGEQKTPDQ